MFRNPTYLWVLLVAMGLFSSCNEYQKALKNEDSKVKYDMAQEYYDAGDFKRANRLFQQIAPKYVGKPQGERVMFFLANSYFEIGDYNFAGYQFERFIKSYPKSDKADDASFLGAKSYYFLSPKYSLDQTDTDKALNKLQGFINAYPESEFLEEANAMARELTNKKEKKAFEIARQYTKLGKSYILEFNISAIAALDNFISDHPGSIYREDALYLKIEAATNLALNSTEFRKKERLEDAREAYDALFRYFPESKYEKDAGNLLSRVDKELQVYNNDKTVP